MCRFAGRVGGAAPLSGLLYEAPHALESQAFAPQRQSMGHVNVDGTGVAWWPEDAGEPLSYVTERPPWSDPNLPHLSRRLYAKTALAAVRSATPGIPFGPNGVQPFTLRGHAFAHNGWVGGWKERVVVRDLVELLPGELYAELDDMNDSRVLFFQVLASLSKGAGPVEAVVEAARLAADVAAKHGEQAALNLCLATPGRLVAVRAARESSHNSLFWSSDGQEGWVASEPLDARESWREVPEEHAVDIGPGSALVAPIEDVV